MGGYAQEGSTRLLAPADRMTTMALIRSFRAPSTAGSPGIPFPEGEYGASAPDARKASLEALSTS